MLVRNPFWHLNEYQEVEWVLKRGLLPHHPCVCLTLGDLKCGRVSQENYQAVEHSLSGS